MSNKDDKNVGERSLQSFLIGTSSKDLDQRTKIGVLPDFKIFHTSRKDWLAREYPSQHTFCGPAYNENEYPKSIQIWSEHDTHPSIRGNKMTAALESIVIFKLIQ